MSYLCSGHDLTHVILITLFRCSAIGEDSLADNRAVEGRRGLLLLEGPLLALRNGRCVATGPVLGVPHRAGHCGCHAFTEGKLYHEDKCDQDCCRHCFQCRVATRQHHVGWTSIPPSGIGFCQQLCPGKYVWRQEKCRHHPIYWVRPQCGSKWCEHGVFGKKQCGDLCCLYQHEPIPPRSGHSHDGIQLGILLA
jgi:hypothetical protein